MFSWKPIYREIADKLPEFATKNEELVQFLVELHDRGLKVSSVGDRDADGNDIQLAEVDPFSFLANFNRGVTNDRGSRALDAIGESPNPCKASLANLELKEAGRTENSGRAD